MDDELRVGAVQSMVGSWAPDDRRGRDSKRRFEEYLHKLEKPFDEHSDDVHVTSSAVVLGPQGTLLYPHDLMPTWVAPGGHVGNGESPWTAAQRETKEQTGVSADHPQDGPRLVHVDIQETPNGHTHLDLRFLLFVDRDHPAVQGGTAKSGRWFNDKEAKAVADESCLRALEVAHTLRDEALR